MRDLSTCRSEVQSVRGKNATGLLFCVSVAAIRVTIAENRSLRQLKQLWTGMHRSTGGWVPDLDLCRLEMPGLCGDPILTWSLPSGVQT